MDEGIHKTATSLRDTLCTSGVKNVVLRDAKGLGHEWQAWRIALHDFVPWTFPRESAAVKTTLAFEISGGTLSRLFHGQQIPRLPN